MGEKLYFSDSDHRFAYFLHIAKKRLGIAIKDADGGCDYSLIALSRKIKRTRGSWSLKVTNFDEIRDGGRQTGNAEKIYERFKQEWDTNSEELIRSAAEELLPFNSASKALFLKLGFPPELIKEPLVDSKNAIYFEVIAKGDVKRAAAKLKKDGIPEGFDDSIKFEAVVDSEKYPPKALIAYAYNFATGIKLTGSDFKGGLNTPCFSRLESFGFKIETKGTAGPSSPSIKHNLKMNTTTRLITSLASKPFVILAGGTGTGKTKCAIEVARKVCRKQPIGESADYEVVAVGADWTDTRPLLGYENILGASPSYTVPKALDLIIRASQNPDRPFFLILDEMNLSHVERYFSDFLSIMESKKIDAEASTIKLHANKDGMPSTDGNVGGKVEQRIQWPDNLFVIGTVNIDETTHMFSPKVLDRAHVIEFKPDEHDVAQGLVDKWSATIESDAAKKDEDDKQAGSWSEALTPILCGEQKANEIRRYIGALDPTTRDSIKDRIMGAWKCLQGSRFSFSHRTAQEAADYIFVSHMVCLKHKDMLEFEPTWDKLTDLAFLQKVLPKINGSAETLSVKADKKDPKTAAKETTLLDVLISEFKKDTELTLCIQKLDEMKATLEREHFVSFIQ